MSTVLAKADALQAKTKKKPLRNGKVMKAKGLKKPSSKKSKVNYRTTTQLRSDRFLAEIKTQPGLLLYLTSTLIQIA